MNPCRDLTTLCRKSNYRFASLRNALDTSRTSAFSDSARRKILATIAIDTLNTWNNFSRAFYLSCGSGAYLKNHGKITTTTPFVSYDDLINRAIIVCKPWLAHREPGHWSRRDEPSWHDVNMLLMSCQNVGVSNYSNITNAISIGTRVFQDLPTFRNYFAHKNQGTSRSATNLASNSGISTTLRPFEILLRPPLLASKPLLKVWLDDLETVVELLCT